jgi:hypothetical protein
MSDFSASPTMYRFPLYGWIGLLVMLVSEIGMLRGLEPFASWHTPIAWTGFILFADAVVYWRRGDSWLTRSRAEFIFLAGLSLPLWLVFEWYNANFLHNWRYVNLPENPLIRYVGYLWSFCTIWPAIFECAELIAVLRGVPAPKGQATGTGSGDRQALKPIDWIAMMTGLVCLVWPIVWPSPYLAAPVFLGFVLLLDPINARIGAPSFRADHRAGRHDRLLNLALSGLVCGLLWELWNYWARAKWIYTVPILPELRIFEMPVLGYFGFPPFALECLTMYAAVRHLFWRGPTRPIAL